MIYLDNNATTFIDQKILQMYMQLLEGPLGNPHGVHRLSQEARARLIHAKKRIAAWFGVTTHQLTLTSGATEALNLAIHAAKGHLITSSLEHAAVKEAINHVKAEVTRLDPLPGHGAISVDQIAQALRPNTEMIVITAANNETGIMTDIHAIGALAKEKNIALVIDAVAYIGKETWTMPQGRVAVAISGHKIHAPVGVGALVTSKTFPLTPLIYGGGQQRNMRGGTENVALTEALALALELLHPADYLKMRQLRDHFEAQLLPLSPIIHGMHEKRVSNVSNLAFSGHEGETMLMKLDLEGVALSHGSACQSGGHEPSHVLTNMGLPKSIVRSSLRFSLSRQTTQEEIDHVAKLLTRTVLMPVNPVSSASRARAPIAI